jgi:hypothetical protein
MKCFIILINSILLLGGCTSEREDRCPPKPADHRELKFINGHFEKKDGRFRITLSEDSTYFFEYPDFIFGPTSESGRYRILGQSLVLERTEENRYLNGASVGTDYFVNNDTLAFEFTNLNDSSIVAAFTLNQSSTTFKTDCSGHLKLPYQYLIQEGIIASDSMINNLTVWFSDTTYSFSNDSIDEYKIRKPSTLYVQINQYKGEKTVKLYREFQFLDSVIVMAMDRKITGQDDSLKIMPVKE